MPRPRFQACSDVCAELSEVSCDNALPVAHAAHCRNPCQLISQRGKPPGVAPVGVAALPLSVPHSLDASNVNRLGEGRKLPSGVATANRRSVVLILGVTFGLEVCCSLCRDIGGASRACETLDCGNEPDARESLELGGANLGSGCGCNGSGRAARNPSVAAAGRLRARPSPPPKRPPGED